jgi:hypothetical protein
MKRKKVQRLDIVRLKDHPDPNDRNHLAHVWEVQGESILISNENMPFQGTYSLTWLPESKVEKI